MSFSVIHITDIHMYDDCSKNPIIERKKFIFEACRSVMSPNSQSIIVISGDIAYSGKSTEYENARELICYLKDEISKYLHSEIKVLLVPGNHDCDFSGLQKMRERLLPTIEKTSPVDEDTLTTVSNVQKGFFDFVNSFTEYDSLKLCNSYTIDYNGRNIRFLLYNSSWMSTLKEEPGKIVIPINHFSNINEENFDCIFSVMHHPYNWLQQDNYAEFVKHIRQTTDVLILGHEHRRDNFRSECQEWSILEWHGKELQGDNSEESAFSIYQFDDAFQNVTTYDFAWEGMLYKCLHQHSDTFMRNTLISSYMLVPSKEYMCKIEDPGMIINHFNTSDVRLSEIFCWHELKQENIQSDLSVKVSEKIRSDIAKKLLEGNISIVIGESLVGKTSFAKMLFKEYSRYRECCVLCNGEDLNTVIETNLRKVVERVFVSEYNNEVLDKYRSLSPEERILIIDDFNNNPYHDERRSKMLSFLASYASHIIIFADSKVEMNVICSQIDISINAKINYYEILNFGNAKRKELITKWYCLSDEFASGDKEVEEKIEKANDKINLLLGASNGFVPATPIYLINILQNLDSIVPASFSGSQYGFLYDSLINKSLSTIKYKNAGEINIDINIMSALAYKMLKSKSKTFTEEELSEVTSLFKQKKKVLANEHDLLRKMTASRLIESIGTNTYKFTYPYIFYYFSGRYIAYNLKDNDVLDQIDYMSSRLYNEKYGNIMIFVCHFANNTEIIENILLIAYTSLDRYAEFDFNNHSEVFEEARKIIDRLLIPKHVGSDHDVDKHRQDELEQKDDAGIQDGTIHDTDDITEEEALREKDMASLSAAMQTMDVLGQIIKNYPGDIDGQLKVYIIDEIHKLGMRIIESMLSTIGLLKEDFIAHIIKTIENQEKSDTLTELIIKVQTAFSWMMANLTYSMIKKTAACLCNESLLLAVEETFAESPTISEKLIIEDLRFNLLRKPNVNEVIQLADEFQKKSETSFAYTILRSIIAQYLMLNKCGYSVRARLCERFDLSDKKALIIGTINSNEA